MKRFLCTAGLAALVPAMSASAGFPAWMDNFDSYTNGQVLDGIGGDDGGWKPWENAAGASGSVTNAQSRSAPHSIQINAGDDAVREYTGFTSGEWVYTAWQFIPQQFTGESYFILLNTYTHDVAGGEMWSVQVHFNANGNMVLCDCGDNAGGASTTFTRGVWKEIRVEIDLDADRARFYYDGVLLDDPDVPGLGYRWTEGVFGDDNGALNIGAVDLFANGAAPVFYDDMSLVAATGACCVDGTNCIGTNTRAECDAAGGFWYAYESCATFQCAPPVFGACCEDNIAGMCSEGVFEEDCNGPEDRFLANGTCGDLNPPCGDPLLFACCIPDFGCIDASESDCQIENGAWFEGENCGGAFACPEPCGVEIPGGAEPEGEACGSNVNGGCNSDPPAFRNIDCGDIILGTAWTEVVKGAASRDTDWYLVTTTEPMVLTWSVEADFEVVCGLVPTMTPGSGDCADIVGVIDPNSVAGPCEIASVDTPVLPAGEHMLFVGGLLGDQNPCSLGVNTYVARLTCTPAGAPCPADFDGDDEVDFDDFTLLLAEFGSACPCTTDLDGDDDVDFDDFTLLLANFGPCP